MLHPIRNFVPGTKLILKTLGMLVLSVNFVPGTNLTASLHRTTGRAELLFRVSPKESGSGDGTRGPGSEGGVLCILCF
jgi:hypothetical protein